MGGPPSVHCKSTAKGGYTLTQQLLSLRRLCLCKKETELPADALH